MTENNTFSAMQVQHMRRPGRSYIRHALCGIALTGDLYRLNSTQLTHRVDCPECLAALEATR